MERITSQPAPERCDRDHNGIATTNDASYGVRCEKSTSLSPLRGEALGETARPRPNLGVAARHLARSSIRQKERAGPSRTLASYWISVSAPQQRCSNESPVPSGLGHCAAIPCRVVGSPGTIPMIPSS